MNAADLPAELVRLIEAACGYADFYAEDLAEKPRGGTSRELLEAVAAWRRVGFGAA